MQLTRRPLLILGLNRPRGRRVRERLIAEAERRSMIVAVLTSSDQLAAVDRVIEATQADAVAVCADPPVQAIVAAVAAARDLPYSCVPAGADDMLARDLGTPMDDPVEALTIPMSTAERTIDLAEVNGIVFVNYVAVGIDVPSPAHLRRATRAARATRARPGLRPERRAPARRGAGGEGALTRDTVARSAVAPSVPGEGTLTLGDEGLPGLLVCNNRFAVRGGELGPRTWPDSGLLCVGLFRGADREHAFDAQGRADWEARSCHRFVLGSRAPVLADVDGEPRILAPPLRFRCVSGALRVRLPGPAASLSEPAPAAGAPLSV